MTETETGTETAFSLESINLRLARLYAAADALVESVLDPAVIEAAPLHHRAQALDAVSRFIHRLEKHKAAVQAEEEEVEEDEMVRAGGRLKLIEFSIGWDDPDLIDAYVAIELEEPETYDSYCEVNERIEQLRREDPDLLRCFDYDAAKEYVKYDRNPAAYEGVPPLQPEIVRLIHSLPAA